MVGPNKSISFLIVCYVEYIAQSVSKNNTSLSFSFTKENNTPPGSKYKKHNVFFVGPKYKKQTLFLRWINDQIQFYPYFGGIIKCDIINKEYKTSLNKNGIFGKKLNF